MTQGTIKSQGTQLFFANPLESELPLYKVTCPTGISGLGGAADQIESTCLDTISDREYERGLGNPGQVSVPFNFIPIAMDQRLLFDLKDSGDLVSWNEAFSDGPRDADGAQSSFPTAVDSELVIVPVADRTSASFLAYVSDITIDSATNDLVRGTLILQRSGKVTMNWKA